jgi:hypothetical protein
MNLGTQSISMQRLLVSLIKLYRDLSREPNIELSKSQFGPPSEGPFSPKTLINSRFLPLTPLTAPKHSLKEVAAHETFVVFFRLNW